jgi:electron transfer flavoprotein alpha subunit
MLKIDHEVCNLCGLCVKSCPFGALAVADGKVEVNEQCTLCGACATACPSGGLLIERKRASAEDLAGYRGVFVWAEWEERDGRPVPRQVVYELLGEGRKLADALGQPLCAVAIGDDRLERLEDLCLRGADKVLACRHHLLGRYSTDGYTNVLSAVVAREKPSILLYGATVNGRDLAPRIAARLRLGLTADCTGLTIDENGQLIQTRPAFGGNIMASIVAPFARPQTATVRPNVFRPAAPDPNRAVVIATVPVTLSKAGIRTRLVEEIRSETSGAGLESARVIVAAGRGCQDPSRLEMIRNLAHKLGGVMAGSRAIVELGWIPQTLQVGQSGTTVAPELYIAVGISGAIQHIVGMSTAKTVIAINTDPEAPIFEIADLGIVGDAAAVLPRLIEAIDQSPASRR